MGVDSEEDRKRKLVELNLRAARKRQSPQTGFVHHCYEADAERHDTIPLLENFCFILALLRSRQSENMLEAIALLHKLLAFEQEGNFPVYLHEFPLCKDRMLGIKLLAVFQPITLDFQAILETSLHDQLQQLVNRILQSAHKAKAQNPFPSRYEMYLGYDPLDLLLYRNNLKNRNFDKEASQNFDLERMTIVLHQGMSEGQNFEIEPTLSKADSSSCFGITQASPDQMAEALIAAHRGKFPDVIEQIAKNWHDTLMTYVGVQEQEKGEPKLTLFDLFMSDYYRNYPARVLNDHPIHLRASLIYPAEDVTQISHWTEVPHQSISSHARQPYTLYWGSQEQLHSLVCDPKNTHCRMEKKNQGVEFFFACTQPCSQDGPFEMAFFCNRHPDHTFLINGCPATTFQLGDVLEIHSGIKLQIAFTLVEGDGIFFGHLSRSNRPLQIAAKGALRYEAFDWQIGLRTISRTEICTVRASLSWSLC